MEFQTEIVDIADDTFEGLFDDTPATTPNANALIGGKKPAASQQAANENADDNEDEEGKNKAVTKKPEVKTPSESIEDIDLDSFEEEDEDLQAEAKVAKEKATKQRVVAGKKEETEESEEEKKAAALAASNEAGEGGDEVKSVLKSTVDYLIEQGLWQDFEGREELDVDEETYAKLVAQQDSLRVNSMFEELVDSTGPFGKAIIDYVKNGGSPDEIIDLFKEQKQVESIPLDSADGQKEMVKHYYSEVLGWKPEKIEKYISGLILSNELENESKEVKELFGSYYKKEADRLSKEQNDYVAKQKEAEVAFETNIKSTIKERKDLSIAEKKTVEDYLLNYDQRLPNGNLVNKFYVNFAKMQANPQDYVDLVMFVMDKQKFMTKVATQEKSKAAAEAFKFIKGNGAVSTKKGSQHDAATRKQEKKVVALDWGLPTKNN